MQSLAKAKAMTNHGLYRTDDKEQCTDDEQTVTNGRGQEATTESSEPRHSTAVSQHRNTRRAPVHKGRTSSACEEPSADNNGTNTSRTCDDELSTKQHQRADSAQDTRSTSSDDAADGSDLDEMMELDDLVVQDECTSAGEEDNLVRRRRCYSENDTVSSKSNAEGVDRAHSTSPFKYKRPAPIICAESIELECFLQHAHFFLVRGCEENVLLAKDRSYWTTSPRIEKALGEEFVSERAVVLVFLVKGADHFSGFARMCSKALYRGQPALCWKEFKNGGNIKLQWISRCNLPLSTTKHLKNSLNQDKAVYDGADGSRIKRATGQGLCSLFRIDHGINLSVLRAGKTRSKPSLKSPRKKRSKRHLNTDLPSLLDQPISFTQFKRARRNLVSEERHERKPVSLLYQPLLPSLSSRSRGGYRDLMKRGEVMSKPVPLMDLAVSRPVLSSRRESGSGRDYERGRGSDRMRHRSPLRHRDRHDSHSYRSMQSKEVHNLSRSSKDDERRRQADRIAPKGRVYSIEKPSTRPRSRSRSELRERDRGRHRDTRYFEVEKRKDSRRRDSSSRRR